jgi:sucrose-6-phosphate hydrolase SacC (GH32 family)
VAEVAGLRAGEPYRLENFVVVNGEDMPPQATGTSLEIAVEFEIEHATAREIGLEVRRSPLGDEKAVIRYDKVTGLLTLDRSQAGRGEGGCFSAPYVSQPGLTLKLRIFVDSSSVEVFTEDGQLAGSACIYPADRESVGVRLFASGGQVLVRSLKVWTLADAGING